MVNSGEIDVSSINHVTISAANAGSVSGDAFVNGSAAGIEIGGFSSIAPFATTGGTHFNLVAIEGGIANSGILNIQSLQSANVSVFGGQTAAGNADVFGLAAGISIEDQGLLFPSIAPAIASGGLVITIDGGIKNSGEINVLGSSTGIVQATANGVGPVSASAHAGVEAVAGGVLAGVGLGIMVPVAAITPIATSGLFISGGITNTGSINVDNRALALASASAIGTGAANANGSVDVTALAGGIIVDAREIAGGVLNASHSSIEVTNLVSFAGDVTASGASANAAAGGFVIAAAAGITVSATEIDGDFRNTGLISVGQSVFGGIHAEAIGTGTGTAQAKATSFQTHTVTGMQANATFLDGDVENSGDISVSGLAFLGNSAEAINQGGPAKATAEFHGNLLAVGMFDQTEFHDGIIENSGSIDVANGALVFTNATADSTGGAATATDRAQAQVLAGGMVEIAAIMGGVSNSGSISVDAGLFQVSQAQANGTQASAFASGIGEEGANGGVVFVAGIYNQSESNTGGVGNSGSIDVTGTAISGSQAQAEASAGPAIAKASNIENVSVFGIISSFGALDGEIVNKGPITALGSGFDNASATATGATATASAFATRAIGSVAGIVATGATMSGAFKNSGAIDVQGSITAHGSAEAHANEGGAAQAFAEAGADMSATAIDLSIANYSNNISNSGALNVSAAALAAASAHANGGVATASAIVTDPFATAVGLNVTIGTMVGSVTNKGTITVTGFASGLANATASATSGLASAVGSVAASGQAFGIALSFQSLIGNVTNSGAIAAAASAHGVANATANGATAIAHADAGSPGTFFGLVSISATAAGIAIFGNSLAGNIANSGAIDATAKASSLATAEAVGTEDSALADAVAGVDAEARGLDIGAAEFTGNIANKGPIHVAASAQATASAKATGATSAQASAHGSGFAEAQGISANFATWSGDFTNSGAIGADAILSLKATADAKSTEVAKATSLLTNDFAAATAIELDAAILTSDAIVNSGALDAHNLSTFSGTATANGATATALAHASGGAGAEGLRVDAATMFGDVSNSGSISVGAALDATFKAVATGVTAKASALAYAQTTFGGPTFVFTNGITATARGLDVDAGVLFGNVVNSGSIVAVAALDVASSASAKAGTGAASAVASGVSDEARASGIAIFAASLTGSFSNSGSVAVGAVNTEAMTAFASSTGAGAKAVADSFDASAVADGLAVGAATLDGDIGNSGALDVTALSKGNSFAHSVAPAGASVAEADASGSGTAIGIAVGAATFTGSVLNSSHGNIDALASSLMSALASATGATANATANVVSATAVANGMEVSAASMVGAVENSGAIEAGAKAVGSAQANSKGTSAIANANVRVFASATGIGVNSAGMDADIENSGSILAQASGLGVAKAVASGLATQETATALVEIAARGIHVNAAVATGLVDNSGAITALAFSKAQATGTTVANATASAFAAGIDYEATLGSGGVSNSGSIFARATAEATSNQVAAATAIANGIGVRVQTFTGNIENSGTMTVVAKAAATGATPSSNASAVGIFAQFNTITGDIDNSGTIFASAVADPARAVGIELFGGGERGLPDLVTPALLPIPSGPGTLFGDVNNSGVISVFASGLTARATGIRLDGTSVTGAINNTGLIIAAATGLDVQANAINVEKAIGPTVINQLDGGMVGDIRMSNGFGDTFNWSGGFIDGNFFGGFKATGDADVLNVFAGVDKAFDYSGNIDGLSVININTTLSAGHHVDFSFGGIVTNTGTLNVNDNGRLLLHPDAIVNVDNYNNAAGGTVGFELTPSTNPADYAHINVAKTANLDGTISADYRAGLYANTQTYEDVIVAGAQVGSFASVVDNSALLDTTVRYDGAFTVDLITKRRPGGFCGISGKTGNQSQVCEALNHAFGTAAGDGDYAFVVGEMFTLPTASAVRRAYDQLGGAQHADAIDIALRNSNYLSRAVEGRLQDNRTASELTQTAGVSVNLGQVAEDATGVATDVPTQLAQDSSAAKQGVSAWLRGFGNYSNVSSSSSTPYGYDSTTWGIAGGVDYQATPQFLVGLGGAYGSTEANFDPDAVSNADVNTFEVGLYASYDTGGFYVDGVANYFHNSIDTKRLIDFAAIDRTAKASYDGDGFNGYGEVGYQFRTHGFLIQPRAGLNYTYVSLGGFTEHGANGADLKVNSNTGKSLSSMLGLRFATDVDAGDGLKVTPELRIGWQHEFLDDQQQIDARFAAAPLSDFSQKGPQVGRDTALIGLGVTGDITSSISVYIDYDGQFGSGFSGNTGSAGVRFKW